MKREFIEFVRKSRINLMLTLAALSMLLVSVMSVTYCWIEGSTFLLISGNSSITDTNKEIVIKTDATTTIELNPYIDNADNLFLAPAKSTDGKTIQILKDGTGTNYRTATVNDIGNNYIAFDVKLNCGETAKLFTFSDDSAISVNNAPTDAIKLSVDVDNTVEGVFSGAALATNGFATTDGEHVLTFRIWYDNESDIDLAGKTVDFNIVLNATLDDAGYADVTFVDNTLNSSKLYLTQDLDKMTLTYSAYGSTKTREMTFVESDGIRTYTLNGVPANATNLIFKGYDIVDTTETLTALWNAGSMLNVEAPVYTAYGSTFATSGGTGTWGNVIKINLNDLSYDQIYKTAGNVSLTNSGKSITDNMYNDVDNHFYTYLAAEDFTLDDTFTFKAGTNTYYRQVDLSELNDLTGVTELTYSIYGKTATSDANGTICYGKFCNTADFITFRDATTNGDVPGTLSIMVSAGSGESYYATYSSANKVWYMYVPTDDFDLEFFAYSGTTLKYTWNGSNRVKTGNKFIYSATAVAESGISEGTWTSVLACSPEILKGEKVSFYGGVDSTWNDIQGMYIAKTEVETSADLTQSHSSSECFNVTISGDKTYKAAKFIEVDSANYYLKHQTTWAGKQIGENAVGGKFYGVYTTDKGTTNTIKAVDATTGATTIASSVPAGTATMNVSTTLSSLKTAANTDMYVQYYVNDELVYTSTVVSTTNYAATIDISKYTPTAGETVTVKTVLTDNEVYYVADTDTFKVASTEVTTVYISTTYNGLYVWSPELMGSFTSTEKNLTGYETTTIDSATYYVVQFENSDFESNTTFNMIVRIDGKQSGNLEGCEVGKTYIVTGTSTSNADVKEYTGESGGGGGTVTNLDYYIGGRFWVYTDSSKASKKYTGGSEGAWLVKDPDKNLKMTDDDGDGIYELATYRTIKELSQNAGDYPQYFVVESYDNNNTSSPWTMYGYNGSDANNFEKNTSSNKASMQVITNTDATTQLFNFSDGASTSGRYVTICFDPSNGGSVWYTLSGGTESETVTITFVDSTNTGWVYGSTVKMYAYDVETGEHYLMDLVADTGNKQWTVTLPSPANKIAFYRCNGDWGGGNASDSVTTYWNKWDNSTTRNSSVSFKATDNNQGSWT